MSKKDGGRVNGMIRQRRKARGLSLDQMGKRCNLSKGYLSRVERGEKVPPVATLQAIATVLGLDVTEFFETTGLDAGFSGDLDILQAGRDDASSEREVVTQSGYAYRPLVQHMKHKYMTPFLLRISKGRTEIFSHDSEEFAFVLQGAVDLVYDGAHHPLNEGDSFYMDSRKPHYFVNHHAREAVMVSVNFNYRRF